MNSMIMGFTMDPKYCPLCGSRKLVSIDADDGCQCKDCTAKFYVIEGDVPLEV